MTLDYAAYALCSFHSVVASPRILSSFPTRAYFLIRMQLMFIALGLFLITESSLGIFWPNELINSPTSRQGPGQIKATHSLQHAFQAYVFLSYHSALVLTACQQLAFLSIGSILTAANALF